MGKRRATSQAGRWFLILDMLAEHPDGLTVAELAVQLNRTPRTIYRDLEALQEEVDIPLVSAREEDGAAEGRWRLLDGKRFRTSITFAPSELFAFLAARELLKPLSTTPLGQGIRGFYDKVRERVPGPLATYLERASEAFVAGAGARRDYREQSATLDALRGAIRDRKTVEMRYRSFSSRRESTRRLDPYRLWYVEGTLYVVGYCHERKEPRTFAVHRIDGVARTERSFEVAKSFRWDDFTRDSFRIFHGTKSHVVVDFTPQIAPLIRERPWHPSQRLQDLPDGVRLELDVAGTFEVTHWLAGFGADARVVAPPELVEHFRRQAAALTAIYARSGRGDLKLARAAKNARERS